MFCYLWIVFSILLGIVALLAVLALAIWAIARFRPFVLKFVRSSLRRLKRPLPDERARIPSTATSQDPMLPRYQPRDPLRLSKLEMVWDMLQYQVEKRDSDGRLITTRHSWLRTRGRANLERQEQANPHAYGTFGGEHSFTDSRSGL